MWQPKLNSLAGMTVLVLGLVAFTPTLRAQDTEQNVETRTQNIQETEMEENAPAPTEGKHYNIKVGSGGLNFSVGLQGRYIDNVFLANTGRRSDYVIQPEAEVAAFFPVGRSNGLTLDLGITYYQYTQNRELNTGIPIINPNSELALSVQVGDVTLRPSEAFSYQESPVYETGGQFFNVENTGRLARYDNLVGLSTKWDLNHLVVGGSYYHENLWANGSEFNYIDHASELLNADAMLAVSSVLTAGLESWGSINRFSNQPILDSWRVLAGPGFRWNCSQFLRARLGAGYERIEYDSEAASAAGIPGMNSYYFYARVDHDLNQFISHSLEGSHDNQLGFNAGDLEGYHINYALNWRPRERLTLSPMVSVSFYHEFFGPSAPSGLYNERFTYVLTGVSAAYQLGEHWRTSVSWAYRLKDSGTPGLGYDQNQAAVELVYAF